MTRSYIADAIAQIINEKSLLQRSVARKAGFTPQQFNDMIKGRKLILAEYMPAIADALGVGVMDIYDAGQSGT